jgi:AcrR family transcriptional regulator
MTKRSVILHPMSRVAAKDREAFVESRRQEILEAAIRLWSRSGYDGTSMAAIAREVGLTKGTLYLYFPGKLALLDEVLRRYSLRPDVEALLAAWQDQPLEDVVRSLMKAAWAALEERSHLAALMLRELPGQLDKAEHFVTEVMLPVNRLLAEFLEAKLPPERLEKINPWVAGRSLMILVISFWASQEILGAGKHLPISADEATDTLAELFLHGVLGGSVA